ncbi:MULTISPECIES: xanthine dehydrogenase accessory protein XdhC [Caulobacter]|jgi:xanthine dehydrogenase accessory factor|uniref:Molybdenum cofactor sulfurylase n=1 Tax=Caulobacter vibrioides OR37 TaxID=1292034 RepID=R0CVP4_CAUVI|nr:MULTISPECIES: xanthine dehydrogenase accessory protein XdhC [Caulobacter]ENZ80430.1 molybdenum cofactor sulfurylase [Caulobacter vibrioides OR37]MBQ1563597.1 xanthine dehydrogenase accessory protein XdhC [Caulobacter sp.]
MSRNWARAALARLDAHDEAALVTVLATEGSAPREAGTKMVVWRGGQDGTIGGGNLEYRVADQARRMLDIPQTQFAIQDYPLGPLLAQCCGGRVRLFLERLNDNSRGWLTEAAQRMDAAEPFEVRTRFEPGALTKSIAPILSAQDEAPPVTLAGGPASARGPRPAPGDELVERADAPRPPLLLFGAGHVGQAIARAFEPLPFQLFWYDTRPETADLPGVSVLSPAEMAAKAMGADPDAFGLVLTHDHALDYALVSAGLAGGGFSYFGVIGSKTKRARFMRRLRDDGFSEAALTRLTCPIGLPQLKSKAPEVIAVSVAADLLMRQEAARVRNDEGLIRASL